MARGKMKEKILTPEEKIREAVVPESEWPYEVPGNWRWVRLSSVYEINPKNSADDECDAAFIPMDKISAGTISTFSYTVQPWGKAKKGHTQFADGDVAFAKISPCFENGKSMIVQGLPNGIGGGTTELIVLRQPMINQAFTYWLISTDDFVQGGCKTYSGTVGQQRISMDYVKSYPVPLPPLPEQQRIVDRIESLFAKLDEAKEKAQAVVDGFEDRKAAIVALGINGDLTKEWRDAQGIKIANWSTVKLSEISKLQTGLMKGKKFKSKTVMMPYLRVANVQDGFLDLNEIKEIEVEENNVDRYLLREGDVLFTEGGDYDKLGRGTVWHNEIENCLHQNHIFVVRTDNKRILPVFLSMQAGSHYGKRYFLSCAKQTTNLASINSTQLKNFPVLLPTIEEQREIVKTIDSIVLKESEAKKYAEQVIAHIDTIKKSILARAFRGELGTNDPSDESAEELLKRIL